ILGLVTRQRLLCELQELPDIIDIPIAGRVRAKPEAARILLRHPRRLGLGVKHPISIGAQMLCYVLSKATTAGRDWQSRFDSKLLLVEAFQLLSRTPSHRTSPKGARRIASIWRGRLLCP